MLRLSKNSLALLVVYWIQKVQINTSDSRFQLNISFTLPI